MTTVALSLPRLALVTVMALPGCGGIQSSLAPAAEQSRQIAALWWGMAAGALAVWIGVVAMGLYYGRAHDAAPSRTRDRWLIVGSGVVFPVVVLTALLAYGLTMIPRLVARAPEGSLVVEVVGEQWWWRVRYPQPDGTAIELANEIRLPVDEPVQFQLTSDDVIHSFWVPALAGKMDMIPGRTTYLAVHPTATGVFAGACAEYCGTAHGYMRLHVEVMPRPGFDAWLAQQARAASPPAPPDAARGEQLLLASGCGACHRIRGTRAQGVIGPDLTHVGSRRGLAAATLPADRDAFQQWLAAPARLKPGVHMPGFAMLGTAELGALAAYLGSLQ
jgi:cytochrome c oxidase subunit 2